MHACISNNYSLTSWLLASNSVAAGGLTSFFFTISFTTKSTAAMTLIKTASAIMMANTIQSPVRSGSGSIRESVGVGVAAITSAIINNA